MHPGTEEGQYSAASGKTVGGMVKMREDVGGNMKY